MAKINIGWNSLDGTIIIRDCDSGKSEEIPVPATETWRDRVVDLTTTRTEIAAAIIGRFCTAAAAQ